MVLARIFWRATSYGYAKQYRMKNLVARHNGWNVWPSTATIIAILLFLATFWPNLTIAKMVLARIFWKATSYGYAKQYRIKNLVAPHNGWNVWPSTATIITILLFLATFWPNLTIAKMVLARIFWRATFYGYAKQYRMKNLVAPHNGWNVWPSTATIIAILLFLATFWPNLTIAKMVLARIFWRATSYGYAKQYRMKNLVAPHNGWNVWPSTATIIAILLFLATFWPNLTIAKMVLAQIFWKSHFLWLC